MTSATDQATAHLTEVFSSIQGEGPYVGARHLFVRFYGCHRRCDFCDSPETVTAWQPPGFRPPTYRFEREPGTARFENLPNPVAPDDLLDLIATLDAPQGLHHAVALTGGEPLLQAPYLAALMPLIRHRGLKTYLETAGDLYHELERVLPFTDIVAMDVKLPSVTRNEALWGHHRHFLQRCVDAGVETFVKAIVSAETSMDDLEQTLRLVADINPDLPLILQPITPLGPRHSPPTPAMLLEWQKRCWTRLPHVRVIPQTHKVMGQL